MKTPGRPLRAESRSQPLVVRLSPTEQATVRRAARVNRQSASQFAREALVTAAGDCLEFRITKP